MVNVVFSHERWKEKPSEENQLMLKEVINEALHDIAADCILYNASVNAIMTIDGNFRIEAKCDKYDLLMKMQSLLPELITPS